MSVFTSKKLLIVAGMVLALFIGVAIGGSSKPNTTASPTGNLAANVVKETVPESENGGSNGANLVSDRAASAISDWVKVMVIAH